MRSQARGLGDNGQVDMGDAKSQRASFVHDLRQQDGGGDVLEALVAVRKMFADVPQAEAAEDGVAEGVQEHVAV